MIDIALAAQGAFKAYELLKKGLATGQEIDQMSGTVRAFFKSKHEVEKGIEEQEKNKDPLAGSSLEEAVEYVEELEAIRRAEERIKWMYISAGKSMLWSKIRKEAERRDKIKAAAKIDAKNKAREEEAFMKDLTLIFGILFGGIIVTGAILFVILA